LDPYYISEVMTEDQKGRTNPELAILSQIPLNQITTEKIAERHRQPKSDQCQNAVHSYVHTYVGTSYIPTHASFS
jgi:hypothetical protein